MTFHLANIQYTAAATEAESLAIMLPLITEARASGAELIALPECATRITADRETLFRTAETEAESRSLATLTDTAASLGCWLLVGSLILLSEEDPERFVNRSFLIGPDGLIKARYDKIHMFDASVNDGQQYQESAHYCPGQTAVMARTPLANIGMTICYDLRFAKLYRDLARTGAEVLTVPAAFTRVTGAAHWHSLLRARAIETGCFVVAPGQTGVHDGGRETWGHSLIIDPWGEILADGGDQPGITMAEINLDRIKEARSAITSLQTNPDWTIRSVGDA